MQLSKKGEVVVASAKDLKENDQVSLLMRDGQVELEVRDVKNKRNLRKI